MNTIILYAIVGASAGNVLFGSWWGALAVAIVNVILLRYRRTGDRRP